MAISLGLAIRQACAGLALIAAAILCAWTGACRAFEVTAYVSGSETLYLKWGDNHAGTPGGTVYWTFIPPGTPGSAYCADACPGNSTDSINLESSPGGGFVLTPLASLETRIAAMMSVWSAHSGIHFVKRSADSGVAINDPTAVPPATGDIRIGVFAFGPGVGGAAVGYSPPPNGGSGAGDVLFNSLAYYQIAPGDEGDAYDQTFAPNDFEGLTLHELGHAVGFAHPAYDGSCPVMDVDPRCLGVIRRTLAVDDINGAHFLYDTLFWNGFD